MKAMHSKIVDITCWILITVSTLALFIGLFIAPFFDFLFPLHSVVMSWHGLTGASILYLLFLTILLRHRLSKISFSPSGGFEATLQEITTKQAELERMQNEICEIRDSLREMTIAIMGLFIRNVENSNRWVGWTPREIDKVNQTMETLSERLQLTKLEWQQVQAPKTRWALIDESVEIFQAIIDKAYPNKNRENNEAINIERQKHDHQWKENEIVSSAYLQGLLDSLKIAEEDRFPLINKISIYQSKIQSSIFKDLKQ